MVWKEWWCLLISFHRIFHEIKIIEDNQFNFIDENEPDDYVERICESMQVQTMNETYFS